MRKHRDAMGWSLQLRGKTYFVYHRLNLEGRLVGKTTGERDREEALRKALEIVCEARAELIRITEGDDYPHNFSDAVDIMMVEEEKLLGSELDKTNPRLKTLWNLGDTYLLDTGWFVDWLRENKPFSVLCSYRTVWKMFVEQNPQLVRINEVRPEHIQKVYDLKRGKVTHTTMVTSYSSWLRGIFKHLIRLEWYHGENPAPTLSLQHNLIAPKDRPNILSDKELDELQTVFDEFGHGFDVAFALMRHTGMRKAEAVNLLWEEVHLDAKPHPYLQIQPHAEDKARGVVKSTIKTRNSVRLVPVRQALLDCLKKHRKESGYVVPMEKYRWLRHNFMLPTSLRTKMKAANSRFHFHLLRHTFISNALMAGVTPVKVAKWVGDSLGMILSTYTHCIPDSDINF